MGVHFRADHNRWQTFIYREGKTIYIGEFQDETAARNAEAEAKTVPIEELPAIKAKHRSARPNGHKPTVCTVTVSAQTLPAHVEMPPHIMGLFQDAMLLQRQFDTARHEYRALKQRVTEAWDVFDEALKQLRSDSNDN